VEPRQYIAAELGDLAPDVLRKILHDNAAALYQLEPLGSE
jgi:predicted TIM-barrel fold metal-dependent hydrolase